MSAQISGVLQFIFCIAAPSTGRAWKEVGWLDLDLDLDLELTRFLRYLVEKYDTNQSLMGGQDEAARNRVRMFIHAAEGTFMVHCLAITYARVRLTSHYIHTTIYTLINSHRQWFSPESVKISGDLQKLESGLAINVHKDLDWLNSELRGKKFLAGDKITAADTMNLFGIQFIFARDLCAGRKVGEWEEVERWVGGCENSKTWEKAVEKTGH